MEMGNMKSNNMRSVVFVLGTAIGVLMSSIALAQTDGSQVTSNESLTMEQRQELGERDFRSYCAPCHGVSGVGDGPVAAELVKKPIDLTKLSGGGDGVVLDAQIRKLIDGRDMPRAHGTSEMPVWGVWFSAAANAAGLLQDDVPTTEAVVNARIERLVDYLKSIQK